jgi:catechol 2,3-dioxygenase-like lactoylglutathione lyase family enzyme
MTTNGAQTELTVICLPVSDIGRAARFYCDTFGFVIGAARRPGKPEIGVTGQFMRKGNTIIELIQADWEIPPGESQPLDRTGAVSHIVFHCEDLEATAAAVIANGGSVEAETRATLELPDVESPFTFLFARDPDGFWLELCHFREEDRKRYAGLPE